TALDGGISMGIHESQSRFYENILGRSKAFCGYVLPAMKALFPQMLGVTEDEFFKAINVVEPSLIRTEADEVTYCLHVLIRYEIEKRVMAGELAVHDIPAEWNRLYKEYLGIDVPDDKHGCLQDSHWSGGLIGYFPSYAIGSAYGAQFLQKMKQDLDVDALMAKGDFAPVNAWLKDKIWQYGRLYTPAQILDNVLGEPFDPNYYLDYLEEKCKAVYGF
ncbi:MAG: carboxypeptidase M32, partial [Firmicutes bacterium]|nr:carboxypeptidase M32 [Bacillota bacterium]